MSVLAVEQRHFITSKRTHTYTHVRKTRTQMNAKSKCFSIFFYFVTYDHIHANSTLQQAESKHPPAVLAHCKGIL